MAGGFGKTNIARNCRFEELVVEEGLKILRYLLREVGAVVVHGEENAFENEARIEGLADTVKGAHELGDALEGEVLGLHGDQEAVGGDERVQGEEIERGGAVEEDEGVVGADGLDGVAELEFAAVEGDELYGGSDEVFAAGNELQGSRCR